ncbi:DUF2637 domain-containing protein [Rhodococcus sp. NPDC058532]|uniref:DUF2637 domain-containing protein n=1 Tax=Rhodococcus sp. NPDC058532 TaxID=3346540 RepID=UPI00365FA4CF
MTRFAAACTYVIAALAFALSYSNLAALAARAGYSPTMAHVWPLAVDGLAVVATAAVMRLRASRTYAWSLLAASTAVSIVAGAAAHLLPAGPLPGWAGAAVAVVPPLCLLVAPHLAVQLHRDAAATHDVETPLADDAPAEVAPVADTESLEAPARDTDADQPRRTATHDDAALFDVPQTVAAVTVPRDEMRRRALELIDEGMSNRAAAAAVGTSEASVRRWRAADAAPALATVSAAG